MIEAIKEIGEYALIKEGKRLDDPVDIIVEDPASSPTYKHVLAIILNKTDEGFEFGGIKYEEYTRDKIGKYLYKQGSSRGTDFTPTARITADIGKTFNNKIVNWFKKILKNKNINFAEEDVDYITLLHQCIEQNKDEILSDLKTKEIPANEYGILTLIINYDGEKYVGDIPIFRTILKEDFATELHYSQTYKIHSISHDKICSVCGQDSDEVYGLASTYKFYNVDKPGFVSGGFNREDAWKNYPVCLNCALKLEAGKKYIEQFLDYKFYTLKYYVIPKFFKSEVNSKIFELLEEFKENSENGDIKLKDKYDHLLLDTEMDVFEILKRQKNSLVNNLMFYEKRNAAFRILLYIEDILPSRLRTLFDKKEIVDKKTIFKKYSNDGKALSFTFGNVWHFFPQNKEHDLSKYFLEIIHKIFVGMNIDYTFLMSAIIAKIRNDFSNNGNTKLSTHRGLQLLDYLNNLDILDNFGGGTKMSEINNDEIFGESSTQLDERVNKIFAEFPDFFGEPAKRAVFLEGGLTQLLLNIQHQERGAQPFRTKLHGLKLDEKLVKRLLPEMQNKLEEYDKNYYRGLEVSISKYMLQAGDGWNISKDEISFYFVLGMNLHYLLKSNSNKDYENTEGEINE